MASKKMKIDRSFRLYFSSEKEVQEFDNKVDVLLKTFMCNKSELIKRLVLTISTSSEEKSTLTMGKPNAYLGLTTQEIKDLQVIATCKEKS